MVGSELNCAWRKRGETGLNAWNKLKYVKYGKIKDIKYVFQKIFLIFWIERQTFLGNEKLKIIERFRITFLKANGRR